MFGHHNSRCIELSVTDMKIQATIWIIEIEFAQEQGTSVSGWLSSYAVVIIRVESRVE